MTEDIVRLWVRTAFIVAGLGITLVLLMYSLFPWRARTIGKLFMAQTVSLALAVDVNVLFILWRPSVMVRLCVNGVAITLIAISAWSMGLLMWKRYFPKKDRDIDVAEQ